MTHHGQIKTPRGHKVRRHEIGMRETGVPAMKFILHRSGDGRSYLEQRSDDLHLHGKVKSNEGRTHGQGGLSYLGH